MLHMPPKILNTAPSGKINVFVSPNTNSTFSNLHSMVLTLITTISPLLLSLKSFTTKPITFSLKKHPQNFIFQNHRFTFPFSHHAHYSVNHFFAIGTIRNYDPVKQYYTLSPYNDPTRPRFVSQEALNLNNDFLLPTHIPTNVPNFIPK